MNPAAQLPAALPFFLLAAGAQPPPPDAADAPARTTAGPIARPMVVEIAKDTYFIDEFGMDAQYLVVVEKRALAIDTGTGFYGYKALIERLTELPYDVVVTHGHPGQAGGMGQLDEAHMRASGERGPRP
jgi:glyoxylase-like metal-dependent hydrolase (beta-lactamase superfamily II)